MEITDGGNHPIRSTPSGGTTKKVPDFTNSNYPITN